LGKLWRDFLVHANAVKVSHNLNFELEWSGMWFGQDVIRAGRWEDSATQAAILDERAAKQKPGPFALEFLVQQYFGFNLKDLATVDVQRLDREPLDGVLRYNAPDAKYHLLLWRKQRERIKKEQLEQAYELALRRVPSVVLSQIKGVPIDQATVTQLRDKYRKRIDEVTAKIAALPIVAKFRRHAGHDFNPSSPDDCVELFYKMLEFKECEVVKKRGRKNEIRISVEADVLEQIEPHEPLARLILDYRHATKLRSTYLDPIAPPSRDNENSTVWPDGMLHAKVNTFFAETGRLSIDEPSLQNWPKRNEESREVRRPFKAAPEHWIVSADYGQIEMRVIAMFTKAQGFVDALWRELDVHAEWARRLAEAYPRRIGGAKYLDDKKAMKTFRGDIKNQWTFPLTYGCSLSSAAGYLNIPERVLRPHYEAFWDEFAEVKRWQDKQTAFYEKYGYVECLTGRRRHAPLSKNMVFNTPVQGTAAEIFTDAMNRLSETGEPELQAELTVHDDLVLMRVHKKRFDAVVEKLLNVMLDVPFPWAGIVPITVELSVGTDWMRLQEIGTVSSAKWFKS
jgi:DNA polymerase-1